MLAPTMGAVMPGRASIQASATWAFGTPLVWAIWVTRNYVEVRILIVQFMSKVVGFGTYGFAMILAGTIAARKPRASGLQGMMAILLQA
ncbi:MAG: hypothetical protein WKF37_05425 [Bryobacteraceae bacterium]